MDIVRDMERLCPNAVFMNFSNPETRIVLAVGMYSSIRCMGLCHGIFMSRHDVSHLLGRPYEQVRVLGAGMNHFQWLLGVRDAVTGEDLYPELRAKDAEFDPNFRPYTRRPCSARSDYGPPARTTTWASTRPTATRPANTGTTLPGMRRTASVCAARSRR